MENYGAYKPPGYPGLARCRSGSLQKCRLARTAGNWHIQSLVRAAWWKFQDFRSQRSNRFEGQSRFSDSWKSALGACALMRRVWEGWNVSLARHAAYAAAFQILAARQYG